MCVYVLCTSFNRRTTKRTRIKREQRLVSLKTRTRSETSASSGGKKVFVGGNHSASLIYELIGPIAKLEMEREKKKKIELEKEQDWRRGNGDSG